MKTKTFWIARDKKLDIPGSLSEDVYLHIFLEKPIYRKIDGFVCRGGNPANYVGALCRGLFQKATGIIIGEGQCKQFKLVEVKGR